MAQRKQQAKPAKPVKTAEAEEPEVEIKIDARKITFGDVEMAMKYQGGEQIPMNELMPFLNRVVVGGVRDLSILDAMPKIMDALNEAFEGMGNQKN